jgi:cell division protein FtsI (penicillin-binding protein 3)
MSSEHMHETQHNRLIVLALLLTFGFSVIMAQLVRYQVFMHPELKEKYLDLIIDERDLPPPRGIIYDARGRILAMNTYWWDISVDPPLVMKPEELADQLSSLLSLPRDEVSATLTADAPWRSLDRYVDYEVGEAILELEASGITCQPRPKRVYPQGNMLAHLLGTVNIEGDGFYGVEGYNDALLKGRAGQEQIERDSYGAPLPLPPQLQELPELGVHLVLTIDSNIQYIVMEELHRALKEYGAESGTVLVMDPQTGAILADYSYPTYDPNHYVESERENAADPAVSSMWEPGSIFKILTWSTGLDTGTITPGTTFYDDGWMEVGGRVIYNYDRKSYGLVTMEDGLVKSLNTVAAYISTTVGKESFYQYLRRFGIGDLTKVDLDLEGPGMMKLPGDSNWFPSDLGTNSFGQGIAVTPLQMITAASAVANRGLLMKPYIVQQYIKEDAQGAQRVLPVEPIITRRAISEETARTMTNMLVEVVEVMATEAQVPGYRIAGKTGTAQIPTAVGYHPTDTIASFVGYAPADDPQFIVLVKLDKPQTAPWGSRTAAPTFRAIAERLFIYLHIPPDEMRVAQNWQRP